ncbi:glycosyltransferase family 4 protein [Galactobacter sp.]|uniref:glycosyltransferase family 4 protein n=1 Tax=Galactobacter sp. TaxID=2676125 RepID=UPI0025C0AD68|nr:glycosyltransferase family 4 protein [Galactobacter sp.]
MLPETTPPRIGYVLKMYPRFSETFIVTEMLQLESAGADLEIFSLRLPVDGRFHPDLAAISAPVTYLQPGSLRAEQLWSALAQYQDQVGPLSPEQQRELVKLTPRDAAQSLDLAREALARGITHLHAHFGSVATSVARMAAALAGIRYSFTAHAKDIFHEDVDPEDLGAKLRDAAAVVTVSDFNLDFLHATYGEAAESTVRIYNGIALERFPFTAPELKADTDSSDPVVISVGRLVEKKGFDTLIDAAAILRQRGVRARFEIVGSGALQDALAAQIGALGLDDMVELIGALPQDRMREKVAAATVFAAPCRVGQDGNRDGLPTVLLESMALGTPCVSTPVTGIPEAIISGETGVLVESDDAEALADALQSLLSDRQLRADYATSARALIEAQFDAARQAGQVYNLIKAIAAGTDLPASTTPATPSTSDVPAAVAAAEVVAG